MDKSKAEATLDELAPGWADAANPRVFIKSSVDPKHRMSCHAALTAHEAAKPAKLAETKPKPKAKAKPKTTTPKKEG